jgi:hypothetical protein
VTSQHDALYSRPDGPYLFKQRQIFLDSRVGTGDHNTERSRAQPLQGVGIPSGIFHREIGGSEYPADLSAHFRLATNH